MKVQELSTITLTDEERATCAEAHKIITKIIKVIDKAMVPYIWPTDDLKWSREDIYFFTLFLEECIHPSTWKTFKEYTK